MSDPSPGKREEPGWRPKAPRDMGAGLFLLALSAVALFGTRDLDLGELSGVGPGLLPRVTALIVAAFGVSLILQGLITKGGQLARWSLRGPVFVLGAVLVFALAVRPLGLLLAAPLAVVIAGLADPETRLVESLVFAIVMTVFCGVLFKDLLGLPIPFDPLGLVPQPLGNAYEAFKAAAGNLVSMAFR